MRRDYVEIDVEGASTEVAQLVGVQQPDLLLLNDEDHAYAKIRLDERSLATVINGLSRLDDSLARALVWGAAWDMTRDAEMAATRLRRPRAGQHRLRDRLLGRHPDPGRRPRWPSTSTPPRPTAPRCARVGAGLRELMLAAEPGSDHQLTFVRAYAPPRTARRRRRPPAACSTARSTVEGLAVDQDLRWSLITALAAAGRAGDAEIDAELERDTTIAGKEQAAAARVAQPTAEAKAAAWEPRS